MMRHKGYTIGFLILLIVSMFFIEGCWGKREVEELAPLIGVGFDVGEKPGTMIITEQYALSKKGASGPEVEAWTISHEVSTAREVSEMTSKIIGRNAFMGSLKVIVISEEVAKVGFKDTFDFAQRYSEFRRSLYLILCKGKAQDILNLKLRTRQIPSLYIKSNIENGVATSTFPKVRLGHYLTVLGNKSTAPILPLIESIKPGDAKIEYTVEGEKSAQEMWIQGAGVLRGDKLIDLLTDDETKGYMWLENDITNRFVYTVGIDDSDINFGGQVLKSSTKYKIANNNGTLELQYLIKVSVAIDEVSGQKEKLSDNEWIELMNGAEQKFASVIEKECMQSLKKERELGLDFLGIGRHIEQLNPNYWKSVKDDWEAKLKSFPVSIKIQVTIHHSGMAASSPTTK